MFHARPAHRVLFSALVVAMVTACGGGGNGPTTYAPPPVSSVMPVSTPTVTLPNITIEQGWAPSQIASAFDYPIEAGFNGSGQTIVIVNPELPDQTDLNTYLTTFGITSAGATLDVVPIDGGSVESLQDDEWNMDTETISGLAPGAKIRYYVMPSYGILAQLDAFATLASDSSATVASMSFGGCESTDSEVLNPLLAQAAAHGVEIFVSSGDYGSACRNDVYQNAAVQFPASSPYVIAVGGEATYTDDVALTGPELITQAVWNNRTRFRKDAAGGGYSSLFDRPSYQSGYGASTLHRNVPDISFPAEGMAIRYLHTWQLHGGTSLSAPLSAAMAAQINQYCGGTFAIPGDVPTNRYYSAYRTAPHDFIDVVTGDNEYYGSSPYYSGKVGYDDASGLGMPLGLPLAATLCGSKVASAHPMARMSHSIAVVPLDQRGAAEPTVQRGVPNIAGMTDRGTRASASMTRIGIVMRATPTTVQDEATVLAELQRAGFTIVHTYANHMVIDATAPASVVQGYFSTSIHDVVQPQYGTHYANVAPIVIPATIAPYVHGVIADDLIAAEPE